MKLTDEQIIDVADQHLYKGYLVFAKEVIDEFCRLNSYTHPQPQAVPDDVVKDARIDLSKYINQASINASDMPHVVVEKLQRVIDAAMLKPLTSTVPYPTEPPSTGEPLPRP